MQRTLKKKLLWNDSEEFMQKQKGNAQHTYRNVLKMCYNVIFVYLNSLQNTLKQNIIATIAVTCYVQRYKDDWHTLYIAWVKSNLYSFAVKIWFICSSFLCNLCTNLYLFAVKL